MDGLTRGQVLSWLFNADSRLYLLENLPAYARRLLNERALSSDCVELVFALVVLLCQYKPYMNVLQGVMRTIEHVSRIRSLDSVSRGFEIRVNAERWYAGNPDEVPGSSGWNDGQAIDIIDVTMDRNNRITEVACSRTTSKDPTIRSMFKQG
jgi:hypothetical protein